MGEWGKRLKEEVILNNNYVKGRLPDPKKRLPTFIPVICNSDFRLVRSPYPFFKIAPI